MRSNWRPIAPRLPTSVEDLHRAVERRQLSLVYQPKFGVRDHRIYGVEALVRWQHPRLGVLTPDDFHAMAQPLELAQALTTTVLDLALRQLRHWSDHGQQIVLAVNCRGVDLAAPGFVELVGAALDEHGVAPQRLCLEITEQMLLADAQGAEHALAQLAATGVRLSLDDFGTGYSCLGRIARLPLSELKVDRFFVRMITRDETSLRVVRGAIQLGHGLGVPVVAEGVEDGETFRLLRESGCDLAQGYMFGRPVAAHLLIDEYLDSTGVQREAPRPGTA